MTVDSKIEWTHHTFNPWWGCTRISPGCDHCYAETFAKRVGLKVWGADAPRRTFGDKHWAEPLKWNRAAEKAGERHRVFCASMADVFEGRAEDAVHRLRLWRLIMDTPHLDWLLLTKRPGAILPLLRSDWANADESGGVHFDVDWLLRWANGSPPANVWLGTTTENQETADKRVPALLATPAAVRFLSAEPLLEHIDLSRWLSPTSTMPHPIDWVIVGGESGPGSRAFDLAWPRSIIRQCRAGGDVAVFVKQTGVVTYAEPHERAESHPDALDGFDAAGRWRLKLADRKGGDMTEWPVDICVRAFPKGGAL